MVYKAKHYNTRAYEVWVGMEFIDVFQALDVEDALDLAIQQYPQFDYHTFIILRAE